MYNKHIFQEMGLLVLISAEIYHQCVCMLSRVWLFVSSWTVARQAPLSMGFSRQEYWSGLPFPTLGDFPDPGIEPLSPAAPTLAGRFFTTELPGKPIYGQSID